ncbi:rab11 family-interacting protein 3 [Megalops cyprinoides]|uniref:rab11 family-interacting protein 3 n=1 Tax=Megalops cyprinoides TaxID=118141 RepID=UPI0018644BD2|nr:rab11 family-interacting protein 3 [Megalops cyprinoides]
MEQVLLSSPGGHSEWELEQKPSLGFLFLDPDKGATLPKGTKECLESDLDFREAEEGLVSLNLENALNLDNLFRNSSEPSLQGASEEPSFLLCCEGSGLSPLSHGLEMVSSETEDKGLFLEALRDPLTVRNAIPESSPESYLSSLSHVNSSDDHHEPLEVQEASELLWERASSHADGSLSLEHHATHSPEEVRLSQPVEVVEQNIPVDTPTSSLSPEQSCEGDCHLPGFHPQLTEAQTTKLFPDGDAPNQDDPLDSKGPDQSFSVESMEEKDFLALTKAEGYEELTADSSLTADAMREKETLDPKPPEGMLQERPPGVEHCGRSGEAEPNLDAASPRWDCPNSLEPELDSSSGSLWTNGQTIEGLSLSEVGASTSLPMGGSVSQREEDLSSLKAVFDVLDQDSDGFVRIEEFVQFATAYGAEQVKDLTRFLDPSGLGVISFEDFYRGITAISNGGSDPLCDVGFNPRNGSGGCPEEYEDYAVFEQNEVTDSAYVGSESTYSECETFTDEDTGTLVHPELHEEVETDSAIDAALHDSEEAGSRLSLGSELNSHSLVTVIGGEEEHFEDFGESHSSELFLETSEGLEGEGSPGSQVLCSSLLLSPSTSKRLSSKKVARHLLQSSALTLDGMDDLSRDILELADTDIAEKVMYLEKRVSELEKDSAASGEQHARLRQENLQLVHRANALEEQLKEQEARAEEALQLEVRRHKEAMYKLEQERGMELENLQSRLQQLDEDNSELRSCVPCLRANIERLEEEKRKLQDEVEDVTERLNEELESRRKMADKLAHERHKSQKEKECTQELIEDLRKQLEHLQLYKLEVEAKSGRSPGAGLQEYQSRTREQELEQEIRRLKQDNLSLKEQNDELNGQIINLSIQGAKNLFSASFSESLAAEISSVSRDELMEAIHKQEEINYRLQDYIDRIIVAIMESNPSILEVK